MVMQFHESSPFTQISTNICPKELKYFACSSKKIYCSGVSFIPKISGSRHVGTNDSRKVKL